MPKYSEKALKHLQFITADDWNPAFFVLIYGAVALLESHFSAAQRPAIWHMVASDLIQVIETLCSWSHLSHLGHFDPGNAVWARLANLSYVIKVVEAELGASSSAFVSEPASWASCRRFPGDPT